MNDLLEILNQALGFAKDAPPLQEIIFALGLSFLLNLIIAAVYKASYRGTEFSQDFVHMLLILGTVVSVIVMVVHGDKDKAQATAFGIFAAFSVIRFRANVAQSRDIGFLFMAMAAGLGVGARRYELASATTVVLSAVVYVFSKADIFAPARASHRLRVRVTNDIDYDSVFRETFAKFLHDYDLLSVESIQAGMMTELRYAVHLKDSNKPGEFVAAIQQLNGNNRVMLSSTAPNRILATD